MVLRPTAAPGSVGFGHEAQPRAGRAQGVGALPGRGTESAIACGGVPRVCPAAAGKQSRNASDVSRPPSDCVVVVNFSLADFRGPEVGMPR